MNPIGDAGLSFDQAIEGLINLLSISKKLGVDVEVTHKIVAFSLNMQHLIEIIETTRVLGVRNYIVQPVRLEDFPSGETEHFSPDESGLRKRVEELLGHTAKAGVKLKLFGFPEAGLASGRRSSTKLTLLPINSLIENSASPSPFRLRAGQGPSVPDDKAPIVDASSPTSPPDACGHSTATGRSGAMSGRHPTLPP